MIIPAKIALRAMNKPGKGSTSFTRAGPLGVSEKVWVISGREAEMVIIDIIVRLLTSNRVAFTCQLSVFIGVLFYEIPPDACRLRGYRVVYGVSDHFSLHQFGEHFFEVFFLV
jgi:hypothetical protein